MFIIILAKVTKLSQSLRLEYRRARIRHKINNDPMYHPMFTRRPFIFITQFGNLSNYLAVD